MIEKKGYFFIAVVIATMIVIFSIRISISMEPLELLMRLCGLYGYFGMSVSTMMTPYLKGLRQAFGKNFVEVHHVTAVIGFGCITVHPIIYLIQTMDATIFLPRLDSWIAFWTMAGAPALILLYIALVAAFLRTRITRYWRYLHALMYLVLTFGIIHADLIQADFAQSPVLLALYNIIFGIVVFTFVIKRRARYLQKKAKK